MYILYNTAIPPELGLVDSPCRVGANVSDRAGIGPAVVGVFNT